MDGNPITLAFSRLTFPICDDLFIKQSKLSALEIFRSYHMVINQEQFRVFPNPIRPDCIFIPDKPLIPIFFGKHSMFLQVGPTSTQISQLLQKHHNFLLNSELFTQTFLGEYSGDYRSRNFVFNKPIIDSVNITYHCGGRWFLSECFIKLLDCDVKRLGIVGSEGRIQFATPSEDILELSQRVFYVVAFLVRA